MKISELAKVVNASIQTISDVFWVVSESGKFEMRVQNAFKKEGFETMIADSHFENNVTKYCLTKV